MEVTKINDTLEIERTDEGRTELGITSFDSVAIARLVGEVSSTNDPVIVASGYNRTYNRHNR